MPRLTEKGTGRKDAQPNTKRPPLAVEWVKSVAAPFIARHGDAGEKRDTEDFVFALLQEQGATAVKACWSKPDGWKDPGAGQDDPAMWVFRAAKA